MHVSGNEGVGETPPPPQETRVVAVKMTPRRPWSMHMSSWRDRDRDGEKQRRERERDRTRVSFVREVEVLKVCFFLSFGSSLSFFLLDLCFFLSFCLSILFYPPFIH